MSLNDLRRKRATITVTFEHLHEMSVSELNIWSRVFHDKREAAAASGRVGEADLHATVLAALDEERDRREYEFRVLMRPPGCSDGDDEWTSEVTP